MSNFDYSDPNNTLPTGQAVPLGLTMVASNVTPSIIVAAAAGLAFGGAEQIYLIQMAADSFGSLLHWTIALMVVVVSLAWNFWQKVSFLIGLIAGYIVAVFSGMVSFGGVENAKWFQLPAVMPYGFEFSLGAVVGVTLVSLVSAIETIGDTSATTKAGSERDKTDAEKSGATTYVDGLGTSVAGVFVGLLNTSFSQSVGIFGVTGILPRHVVTIAGIIIIICGLIPKIGAVFSSMPLPVLGGGVIVMFDMVTAAGMNMLSTVSMNRLNMIIISFTLTVGLGLNLVPTVDQHLPGIWKTLATSVVAPTAFLAVIMNLVLPEDD